MSTLHHAEHCVRYNSVLYVSYDYGPQHKLAVNTPATTAIQPSRDVVLPRDMPAFEALE